MPGVSHGLTGEPTGRATPCDSMERVTGTTKCDRARSDLVAPGPVSILRSPIARRAPANPGGEGRAPFDLSARTPRHARPPPAAAGDSAFAQSLEFLPSGQKSGNGRAGVKPSDFADSISVSRWRFATDVGFTPQQAQMRPRGHDRTFDLLLRRAETADYQQRKALVLCGFLLPKARQRRLFLAAVVTVAGTVTSVSWNRPRFRTLRKTAAKRYQKRF